jgi:hypothetical protein
MKYIGLYSRDIYLVNPRQLYHLYPFIQSIITRIALIAIVKTEVIAVI